MLPDPPVSAVLPGTSGCSMGTGGCPGSARLLWGEGTSWGHWGAAGCTWLPHCNGAPLFCPAVTDQQPDTRTCCGHSAMRTVGAAGGPWVHMSWCDCQVGTI